MCGRFVAKIKSGAALPMKWRELHALLSGYNIAPSQDLLAVLSSTGEPEPIRARWGLVTRWRPEPLINARAETIASKPSFRDAFQHRRCIVPADGWYEWQKRARAKQPYYIHARGDQPFAFAGIWEPDEQGTPTLAIITTQASPSIAAIHDRMPAILTPDAWPPWLAAQTPVETLAGMLTPPADDWLAAHPVSSRVNTPRNNDPQCMAAITEAKDEPGLFG